MIRLLLIIATAFGISAASAQGINGGGSGNGTGFTCASGTCTSPNDVFVFKGPDGSIQFETGSTATAVDFLQSIGGISGAGATLFCQSGSDTNVSCNITAKGNANVNFANSGSGPLASGVDPGAPVSSGGAVQLTPSVANGPVKVGHSSYGVNLDCGTNALCQAGGYLIGDVQPYIVGNWTAPYGPKIETSGVAPGTGSIHLYPAYIKQTVTLNSLGVRITTLAAAGNCQLAIYANNPATGRPTGSALASTASISTTAIGSLNSAVSVQLQPNLYWWAVNCDNATVTMTSIAQTDLWYAELLGSTTQANAIGSGVAQSGLTVVQTFGTWPSLTAASFVDGGLGAFPIVQIKAASVP